MTDVQRTPGLSHTDAAAIMKQMHKNVRAVLAAPLVWETARKIIADIPARHEIDQAIAIRTWIAKRFRFVNDPLSVQLLTDPLYLLEHIQTQGYVQGNCADAAMLAAALCEAIRINCKFVSVAFNTATAPFAHVFTMAYPHSSTGAQAAVEFDVTRPPGLQRAHFTRHLEMSA